MIFWFKSCRYSFFKLQFWCGQTSAGQRSTRRTLPRRSSLRFPLNLFPDEKLRPLSFQYSPQGSAALGTLPHIGTKAPSSKAFSPTCHSRAAAQKRSHMSYLALKVKNNGGVAWRNLNGVVTPCTRSQCHSLKFCPATLPS